MLNLYLLLHIKANKWLLEDCCDALGSMESDVTVGHSGNISTLSFFPAHHITTGEGGSVQTNNADLYRLLQQYGSWGRGCHCSPGKDNTCSKRFEHSNGIRDFLMGMTINIHSPKLDII